MVTQLQFVPDIQIRGEPGAITHTVIASNGRIWRFLKGLNNVTFFTDSFRVVYTEWKDDKLTAVAAMKQLDMKPNTFYRRVKEIEV
jgi:hypothetical protein